MDIFCSQCNKLKTKDIKWSNDICRTCYKKQWRHKTNKTNTNWKDLGINTISLKVQLKEKEVFEAQQISDLLNKNKTITEIKEILNIKRNTLSRRIVKYNIQVPLKEIELNFSLSLPEKTGTGGFYRTKCKKCNSVLLKTKHDLRHGCGNCLSLGQSSAETEIKNLLNIDFKKIKLKDNLTYKEIDLYSETYKIGIEYCGLYWHSENVGNKDKNYHLNKLKLANKNGIRLITIFEDEWLTRKQQVLGFLQSVFKINNKTVYARKCTVKDITKEESVQFLNENHIQGAAKHSKIFVGIFHDNELLGVMTFGKHHRDNKCEKSVLDRLAFKAGTKIIGGASKLLKFSIKEHSLSNIVSWSDNRWSEGNVYNILGFKMVSESYPDYSYVKNTKRYSKQSLKKTAFEKLTNKTETELRKEQKYLRIWDCGKKRWELNVNLI